MAAAARMCPLMALGLLAAVLALAGPSGTAAQAPSLALTPTNTTVYLNDGDVRPGSIKDQETMEWRFMVDGRAFPSAPFDLEVTLDVLSGDADLVIKGPRQFMVYSEYPTGGDVLFVPRGRIQALCLGITECMFRIIAVGYSPRAEFVMRFDIERNPRIIHPQDQQALEEIFRSCCKGENACSAWGSAVNASGAPRTTNFCHLQDQICDVSGHITHLGFGSAGMECELPVQLGSLVGLERLQIFTNKISGEFSQLLSLATSMPNLKHVHMADNLISGALGCCPASTPGCLSRLETLDLKRNQLSGALPRCLLDLPELGVLDLGRNQLVGGIPSPIPASKNLVVLDVREQSGAGMSGPLPDFRPLENLALLALSTNSFSGPFPPVPPNLETLLVAKNLLSGPFDPSVQDLKKIWIFDAGNNAFTGPIPANLATAPNAKVINLSSNRLSGAIPANWTTENLRLLTLDNNELSGPLPGDLASLKRLSVLNVSANRLNGTLEDFAANVGFSVLRQFAVAHNEISGPLPASLIRLGTFDLYGIVGSSLPQVFDVSYNRISGPFVDTNTMDLVLELGSDETIDFTFNIQGNYMACPDPRLQAVIVLELPGLATSTCTEGGSEQEQVRTIDNSPVPLAVRQAMGQGSHLPQVPQPQSPAATTSTNGQSQGLPSITEETKGRDDKNGLSTKVVSAQEALQAQQAQQPDPIQASLPIIIGVVVGGGLMVILAVLLGVFVVRPRLAKRRSEGKYRQDYMDNSSHTGTVTAVSVPIFQAKGELASDQHEAAPSMKDIEMS